MSGRFDRAGRGPGLVWAAAIASAWLLAGYPAWAGGGGADSTTVQNFLNNNICSAFGVTNCPQLPTINQLIVEAAAISGQTPAVIRGPTNLNLNAPPGSVFDAGTLPGLVNPLAFIAAPGQATPTSPSNPAANSFVSATTNSALDALNLSFGFAARTAPDFAAGQTIGDIMLPLVVTDGSQNVVRNVAATLHITGTGAGPGFTTDVVGDFLGTGAQTYADPANELGISTSLSFANNFLEVDLSIPLVITSDIAPAYIFSAPGFEFAAGLFDGINPVAMFQDARFVDDAGDLLAAAHPDLAIAFDGSTVLSAPVAAAAPEPASCALLGSGLVGWALSRRRARRSRGGGKGSVS